MAHVPHISIAIVVITLSFITVVHAAEKDVQEATASSTLIERFNGYRIPAALYEKIIETLKPTNISLPEFLTPAYYKDFIREANDEIKGTTGVDAYHIINTATHWFSSIVTFLREILQKI